MGSLWTLFGNQRFLKPLIPGPPVAPQNSINKFRHFLRLALCRGKDWRGMSWNRRIGHPTCISHSKTPSLSLMYRIDSSEISESPYNLLIFCDQFSSLQSLWSDLIFLNFFTIVNINTIININWLPILQCFENEIFFCFLHTTSVKIQFHKQKN